MSSSAKTEANGQIPGNGFFKVVITVCSNPSSIPVYMRQSFWIAAVRYILLSIICLLGIIALRSLPLRNQSAAAIERFQAVFGKLQINKQQISPTISPEKAKKMKLGQFNISYFPNTKSADSFIPDDKSWAGLLWAPQNAVVWRRIGRNQFSVFQFPYYLFTPHAPAKKTMPTKTTRQGIIKCLKELKNSKNSASQMGNLFSEKWQEFLKQSGAINELNQVSLVPLIPVIWLSLLFGLVGAVSIFFILIAPAYIILCCTVMHIFRGPNMPRLELLSVFKMGTYAAFPALIIASAYTALDLPFLDFQMVFSLAFLIYLFIVYGRVKAITEGPLKEKTR